MANTAISNTSKLSAPFRSLKGIVDTARDAASKHVQQTVESAEFPYHGKWCGPNLPKKGENPTPIDDLDKACRRHDRAYARGFIKSADRIFVSETSKMPSVKAQLASAGFAAKSAAGLSKDHSTELVVYKPQSAPLVGIELNPGPDPKKKLAKYMSKFNKAVHKDGVRLGLKTVAKAPKRTRAAKASMSNVAANRSRKLTANNIINSNRGERKEDFAVVPFDEYIIDVNGSTGTNLVFNGPFQVNPGQVATFPLLSKDAVNWEKWKMVSDLTVYYKREVSEFATNGTTGKVLLHYLSDNKAPLPANKQAIESTDYHADGMPSEFVELRIPAHVINADRKSHLVRPGNLPGSSSIADYDGGKFLASTYGNAATTVVGELRIKGTIMLMERVLESSTASLILQESWFSDTVPVVYTTTIYQDDPVPVIPTVSYGLPLNPLNIVNNGGLMTPPAGSYKVHADILFTSTGYITNAVAGITKNGVGLTQGAYYAGVAAAATSRTYLSDHVIVSCNGTDAIAYNAAVTGTGTLNGYANVFFTAC